MNAYLSVVAAIFFTLLTIGFAVLVVVVIWTLIKEAKDFWWQ